MRILSLDREHMAGNQVPTGAAWRGVARWAVAFAVALALLWAVWLLAYPLALLFAAIVLAEAFEPVVSWLERRVPRLLAAVLVYLLAFLAIGGILWLILPTLFAQAQAVFTELPAIIERARGFVERVVPLGDDRLISAIRSAVTALAGTLLSVPMLIFSVVVEIVLVIVLSIYWLIASPAVYRFVLSLVPDRNRDCTRSVLTDLGRTLGGFVRATVIDGFIVAAISYLGLLLIGVDFPLVLALIAGVGELIPMVGPFLAAIPAVSVAFVDGSLTQAIIVAVFYTAVQQFENHLLIPYVVKSQTDVPPILAVFALFAGAYMGGALWALIAIPLAGALRVLVVRVFAPLVRRWTGAEASNAAET